MRQRIVRLTLVGGVLFLALLLLLATCGSGGGGGDDGKQRKPAAAAKNSGPATRLTVPSAYTTSLGWEVVGAGPDYAVSHPAARLAYLVREPEQRYRLRTVDLETGRDGWSGEAWRPPDPLRFPKLLTMAREDRQFFVTWAFGKIGDGPAPLETFVSLDVYDAENGERLRVEVPWSGAPTITATGPDIVISDGRANSAVVDPVTGEVSEVAASGVKYPKGCTTCKRLTEVRGQTAQGLLLSGSREFWVRGGWFSRKVAPKGTDPRSGVPTSVNPGLVLAKWQLAKGAKRAATHELWTVHDAAKGKAVVSVECHRPAIAPGRPPQALVSPSGRYLVAGNLAFDLEAKKGFCFEDKAGASLLTLASVTDDGTAYGARNARDAADALEGGGTPVVMNFTTWGFDPLSPNERLPDVESSDTGVFRWTDRKDRLHLLGYPRTG
ncbi:hypothetical protein OG596_27115 [Streptomyces sp. NBC_01102]|uniref:hypothetical protein n=1 Tax=unclassified Streptomyces TaxID=2593676 RepID=UPI0038654408|nr:hypothetical protein OG596_27115 [Streptomyces sp. NBC_01102]